MSLRHRCEGGSTAGHPGRDLVGNQSLAIAAIDRAWALRNNIIAMPKTLTEVTRDAAELPPVERLKLVRILLDLSETGAESKDENEAAWDREIERRLKELQTGKVQGVSLEEVKSKIEPRFQS